MSKKETESGGSENHGEFKVSGKPLVGEKELPAAPGQESAPAASGIDAPADLPRTYGSNTIFLIAQEPHWLFTYWDLDIAKHPGGPCHLRVIAANGTREAEIEVPFETRNWYIPVKESGAVYEVEIGYYRGQSWHAIARSAPAQTPRAAVSPSERFDYATIPLHLSFHQLMERLNAAIREGDTLMGALSRLQAAGHLTAESIAARRDHADEKALIEALLGGDYLASLTSGGFGSEEITAKLRVALEEKLSSAGASEFSAALLAQAPGSAFLQGLSSGEMASWASAAGASWSAAALSSFSTAALSSWSTAALSSWAAAALSSWASQVNASWASAAGASWAQAALTSWGERALSSWAGAAQASWAQAAGSSALSSWGERMAAPTSWSTAQLSSWLLAAQTSWAGLSSWNEAAFSSWAAALGETSWAGGSESLSSPGMGREFFMHVNAEVIFYGGTDPCAKVTVDGKPIALNPDGSFRYHFIFPDGKFEIPIIAVSPDGVETRKAVLRFERGTEKVGGVDDTGQPPLVEPMGRAT